MKVHVLMVAENSIDLALFAMQGKSFRCGTYLLRCDLDSHFSFLVLNSYIKGNIFSFCQKENFNNSKNIEKNNIFLIFQMRSWTMDPLWAQISCSQNIEPDKLRNTHYFSFCRRQNVPYICENNKWYKWMSQNWSQAWIFKKDQNLVQSLFRNFQNALKWELHIIFSFCQRKNVPYICVSNK